MNSSHQRVSRRLILLAIILPLGLAANTVPAFAQDAPNVQPPAGAPPAASPIPHPHPVLTEVLFNVPTKIAGDADGDGERSAIGDEFVELTNPHDQPIQLKGYTIRNRVSFDDPTSGRGVSFTFPKFELPPGGVVVVFNGYESGLGGPIGSPVKAPTEPHPDFDNAYVFSMANNSRFNAFNNGGDWVIVQSPKREKLDCISWGKPDPSPPEGCLRLEDVSASPKGSVQRAGAAEAATPHGRLDGRAFSPGEVPAAAP